jgi:hypothetical protein
MRDFMILGGAVMMSALVDTSAQIVTLASTFDAPLGAAAAAAAAPAWGPP